MNRKFSFLICLLFYVYSAIGQSNVNLELNSKYWYYRDRLNYFMTGIGPKSGESLTFTDRLDIYNAINDNTIVIDDTPNELGFYIGVLATEYKLQSDEGANTILTARELFYALEALNRLDTANSWTQEIYNTGLNCCLDGVLIRDDLPLNATFPNPLSPYVPLYPTMATYNKNVNFVFKHNGASNKPIFTPDGSQNNSAGLIQGCSDQFFYPNFLTTGNPECQYMSQDHYIRLMIGLSLVAKLVDVNASYPNHTFIDGETSFAEEAKKIVHRIVSRMQSNYWLLYKPQFSPGPLMTAAVFASVLYSWASVIPPNPGAIAAAAILFGSADIANQLGAYEGHKLVYRGNTATRYSYGWAKAANFINGINYYDAINTSPDAILIWKGCTQLVPAMGVGDGNLSQIMALAAIGDSWNNLWGGQNVTEDHLIAMNNLFDYQWDLYPLLWAVLHNQNCNITQGDIEQSLLQAPCEGIRQSWLIGGWSSRNKFLNKFNGELDSFSNHARNGLDYMLLYNLYCIQFRNTLPKYSCSWDLTSNTNTIYRHQINIDEQANAFVFPSAITSTVGSNNWNTLGTLQNPMFVRSEENLEDAWSQINVGAHVEYRSTKDVHIFSQPNGSFFHAINGAIFHIAGSTPNDCVGNGAYNYSRLVNNQPNTTSDTSKLLKPFGFRNIDVEVFPNPSNDKITLNYILPSQSTLMIQLSSIDGKELLQKEIKEPGVAGQVTIPVNIYSPGIYMLTVLANGGKQTRKITIQ